MDTFSAADRKLLAKLWTNKRVRTTSETSLEETNAAVVKEEEPQKPSPTPKASKTSKYAKRTRLGDSGTELRRSKLAKACNDRLAFSQFRSINEYLYSHSSKDAQSYMDETIFDKYHTAYDEIAAKWPVKPIDEVITLMETIYPHQGNGFVFADMGCGSKPLIKQHFGLAEVHSFDLVSTDKDIVKADIANVPLEKKACNCVVFCLSLMGTNVKDYILEANRILKRGGNLIIAEVSSRFEGEDENLQSFVKKLEKGYGFRLKSEKRLPPNDFFVLLQFNRVKSAEKLKTQADLFLKPCIYKPR